MLDIILIQRIIEIYAWTVAILIIVFITAIAEFYQKKFGVRTFYYFYTIPIIILLTAAIHIISSNTSFSGLIGFLGSLASFTASYYLYRIMVGEKSTTPP